MKLKEVIERLVQQRVGPEAIQLIDALKRVELAAIAVKQVLKDQEHQLLVEAGVLAFLEQIAEEIAPAPKTS